jgi:DNA invertase Pin-like site-specific DNA recombinase
VRLVLGPFVFRLVSGDASRWEGSENPFGEAVCETSKSGHCAVCLLGFKKHLISEPTERNVSSSEAKEASMNAARKPRRVGLYLRVSTSEQTTRNQRRELKAVAERHGWEIVSIFEDDGISGAKGREKRPGLDAMLKAVARRDVDMVAAWSVDRLGRSLTHLVSILQDLHAKDVDLYLHQQGLDTSTPSGRAMFQMLGVFAEFERALIRERVVAGLARAKDEGTQLGRPRLEDTDSKKVKAVVSQLAQGKGVKRIARDLEIGVGTVIRIRDQGKRHAA